MSWIVMTLVAVLVAIALFPAAKTSTSLLPQNARDAAARKGIGVGASTLGLLVAGAWLLFTLLSSFHQVDYGNVGLIFQFGTIVGQVGEGPQFIAPWQSLEKVSVQVQRKRFDQFVPFSKETQDVYIIVSLNYRVAPEKVQELYRAVGPRWFDALIEPRVINFFKEETVKYSSVEIAPHREDIRQAVRTRLASELKPFSIDVVDLLIDNIDFNKEFKASIEAKQIASQDALREQERVKQKQYEADQKRETAKGDADVLRTNAQGQADANRLIAASLTTEVIQFQAVQKLADNVQVAILPSGQGVLIDPSTFLTPRVVTPAGR